MPAHHTELERPEQSASTPVLGPPPTSSIERQQAVIKQTRTCIQQAELALEGQFSCPEISFKLRGKAAGQFRYHKRYGKVFEPELRFNALLLEQNYLEFLAQVVPHEVAHFLAYTVFGTGIKPHGKEWRLIMEGIFKCDARVTHEFLVESKKGQTFEYRCHCENTKHQLGIIRHRRIMRGQARYLCRHCNSSLVAS